LERSQVYQITFQCSVEPASFAVLARARPCSRYWRSKSQLDVRCSTYSHSESRCCVHRSVTTTQDAQVFSRAVPHALRSCQRRATSSLRKSMHQSGVFVVQLRLASLSLPGAARPVVDCCGVLWECRSSTQQSSLSSTLFAADES